MNNTGPAKPHPQLPNTSRGPTSPNIQEAIAAAHAFAYALEPIGRANFEARGFASQEFLLGRAKRAAKELMNLCSPLFELLVEEKKS